MAFGILLFFSQLLLNLVLLFLNNFCSLMSLTCKSGNSLIRLCLYIWNLLSGQVVIKSPCFQAIFHLMRSSRISLTHRFGFMNLQKVFHFDSLSQRTSKDDDLIFKRRRKDIHFLSKPKMINMLQCQNKIFLFCYLLYLFLWNQS